MAQDIPSGFVLSDSAMYAFECQDVYPDLLSFAAAIPDHLKPLFLIPVFVQHMANHQDGRIASIANRIANEFSETGDSDVSDLFSYQTFVNYDNEPNITPGEEGSINDPFTSPGDMPVSQPGDQFCGGEPRYDARVWEPTDTSYMTDGDSKDLLINEGYPYRMNESPVRHSSRRPVLPIIVRLALCKVAIKPDVLQTHAPDNIKERAKTCSVRLVSYYKPNRMFTFSTDCGNGPHLVRAVLSELDQVAMTCDCPFWRWNGPEYHAKQNDYMFGRPRGTAAPPNIRDPDRKYWLCKHAYAALRRLEHFVQQVIDENWEQDDDQLLQTIDKEWDRMAAEAKIPLTEAEKEDPTLEVVGEVSDEDIEEAEAGKTEPVQTPEESEELEPPLEPEPTPEEEQ